MQLLAKLLFKTAHNMLDELVIKLRGDFAHGGERWMQLLPQFVSILYW